MNLTVQTTGRRVSRAALHGCAVLVMIIGTVSALPARPDVATLNRLRALPVERAVTELRSLPAEDALQYALALFESSFQRGDRRSADRFLEAAEAIARVSGKVPALAEVLTTRAVLAQAVGDVAGAIGVMAEVVELTETARLTEEHIMSLVFLGNLQHRYGVLAQAADTMGRVLAREADIENRLLFANALSETAMLNYKLGRLDDVAPFLERALPIFREFNDENGIGTVYRIYGNYHNGLGQVETAIDYYERARAHYVNTNNVHDYANISFNIGLVFLQAGMPMEALPNLENAIENFANAGSLSGAGMAGTELGRALYQLRRFAEAEQIVQQARRHLESSQSFLRLAQAHAMYGAIRFSQGDNDGALSAYGEALRLYRRLGLAADERRTLETIIRIREGTQGEIEL